MATATLQRQLLAKETITLGERDLDQIAEALEGTIHESAFHSVLNPYQTGSKDAYIAWIGNQSPEEAIAKIGGDDPADDWRNHLTSKQEPLAAL
jgi:hypothetical protein